jgi:dihydrofolate reductase
VVRELTYYVAVSLDGRIAGPEDDFSAFPVEGDHVDMVLRDYRDTLPSVALEALGLSADGTRFDTVLMGWRTYAAGLAVTDSPYPHLRQYVLSRSPRTVPDPVTLTGEDPVALVRRLKREDGAGIWLCGGGVLAGALLDEVDRLVLKVNPVLLGEGPALLERAYEARSFRLERSTPYASGVVVNEYLRS